MASHEPDMSFKENIDLNYLPRHIAIIMDGNGRWALQKGKPRTYGHKHGVTSVKEITEGAAELGIKFMTLYAFSTENWKRPKFEVDALMHLLLQTIHTETKNLNKNKIRLTAIGDLASLPHSIYNQLMQAIRDTSGNDRMTLTLALSYSGRWEILEAARSLVEAVRNGQLAAADISETSFSSCLSTASMPDPELLIRTSGENRVSNFLLWQIAYSELYFTPKLWPDFRKEDLYEAIYTYQHRERRFGKTSEQIKEKDSE